MSRWRAVAYTPQSTRPCRTCGKPAVRADCQTCAWRRSSFLEGELAAVGYGSLVGAVTEEEWRARASLLMRLQRGRLPDPLGHSR
jgi:hypothetical protein